MNQHFAVVSAYLALSQALETDPAAYAAVFHPDIEQIEYPNLLTQTTQYRSFGGMLDNMRAGRELLRDAQFEHTTLQAGPDGSVVVETYWHATAMHDFNLLVSGSRVSAQMCMIFEFSGDLVYRLRTYRCYEPFTT